MSITLAGSKLLKAAPLQWYLAGMLTRTWDRRPRTIVKAKNLGHKARAKNLDFGIKDQVLTSLVLGPSEIVFFLTTEINNLSDELCL